MKLLVGFMFIFSVLYADTLMAQDTLVLLNGEIRTGKIINIDSSSVTYSFVKRKKVKTRTLSNELIYSISTSQFSDSIIYRQNGTYDHKMSVVEKKRYLLGMQDAKSQYKSPWSFVGGVVFNAGVGYLLYDNFWAAVGPIAYTAGAGITEVKIKPAASRPQEITSNPLYQEGYLKIAKSKKLYRSITGSLLGLLIGIGIGNATH